MFEFRVKYNFGLCCTGSFDATLIFVEHINHKRCECGS